MKQFFLSVTVMALLLAVTGCVKAPQTAAVSEEAVIETPAPDQQMAVFLGEAVPGSTAMFADTSLGPSVSVTTLDAYVSALGEFCREGRAATAQGVQRVAACQDKNSGKWRLAPAIFGSGTR